MRIAVIHHEADGLGRIGRTLLSDFCAVFAERGHAVAHLRGTARFAPADLALLHVNLSVVPDAYVALGRRYPRLLNGRVVDTRKRRVSQAQLRPGQHYDGPVIVKSDLNHGGVPERARLPLWRHFWPWRAPMLDYPVFPSLAAVPAGLRDDPGLVVERFVPEREGDRYFLRQAYFLGDRDISWRLRSRHAVIRFDGVEAEEEIPTPPAVRRYRRELGLDYGKIDYVEHRGEVIVLDVNKTIGGAGSAPQTVARLAPALEAILQGAAGERPENAA